MIEGKKASILLVLNILKEHSDANHYLTHQDIIDKIYALYGQELERKSVARSIAMLEDLGYDIVKGKRGGFALVERTFDPSEVRFLVDAIFSSKSIPGSRAQDLATKVSSELSKNDRRTYRYLTKSTEVSRTTNKEVFYNIELINEAIKKGKWVGFHYVDYDENGNEIFRYNDYVYHRSPCYLINNFGKYYLLAYGRHHDAVETYRVDYMKDVYMMEDRERVDPKNLKEFAPYHSITEYLNDHIYMFGGPSVHVTMALKGPYVIQYIYDWFGKNAKIHKKDDQLLAEVKCNEKAFFYWVMQYGEHIKVLSPQSMVDKVKKAAEAILKQYE